MALTKEDLDRLACDAERTLTMKMREAKKGNDWVVDSHPMSSCRVLELVALALNGLADPTQRVRLDRFPSKLTMPNGATIERQEDGKYWTVTAPSGGIATNETDEEVVEAYGLDTLFRVATAPQQ